MPPAAAPAVKPAPYQDAGEGPGSLDGAARVPPAFTARHRRRGASMIARPNHTRLTVLLPVLAALVLVLAACTGDAGASSAASASAAASTTESTEPSTAESAEASEDGAGGATTVALTGFAFDTDEITISAGETVTFVNEDSAAHTVTEGENGDASDGARFDEQIAAGESTDITFDEAGDYNVTCLFHGNMNMVVHVE